MGFISWIILGLLAGILAKYIMPGKDGGGFVVTALLGIAGAFVGGWLGSFIGIGTTGEFSFASLLTAVVGALVLLFVYRTVKK
ncbi:MAG: GlsB/YeaQ/YmgE family stress response membrane protein [Porticoccaceae bacterium]|nr:GlsB/YeaQ/YmgE family stress response membrane protein [Porticoccaceae bacterium]